MLLSAQWFVLFVTTTINRWSCTSSSKNDPPAPHLRETPDNSLVGVEGGLEPMGLQALHESHGAHGFPFGGPPARPRDFLILIVAENYDVIAKNRGAGGLFIGVHAEISCYQAESSALWLPHMKQM